VLEQTPFCWMCDALAGKSTKEHIFARQLQARFPSDHHLDFHMARLNPITPGPASLEVTHERGPLRGGNLVAGGICATCNNGWMSSLESPANAALTGPPKVLDHDEATMLARWFAKTAAVINVSQQYRMLWEAERRHQLQFRVPDNVAVSIFRVADSDLDWAQGEVLGMANTPDDVEFAQVAHLMDLTHFCRIQVGTLVGMVVAYPWQLYASEFRLPGSILWRSRRPHVVDLSLLEGFPSMLHASASIDVRSGSFWQPADRESARLMSFRWGDRSRASGVRTN
jgi:hypothetical protein